MKIAVIGAGGVGGYFGGRIANAGYDVVFIARGEHLQAIQQKGLLVKSINGDLLVSHAKASGDLNAVHDADLIILAIKAWQVKDMAQDLKPVISEKATVLPLQNGVLAAGELSEVLGAPRVLNGLCRIISKIESPGVINHMGIEPAILFGEQDNQKTGRTRAILDMMNNSGIRAKIPDDIQAEVWKKFINICVSGLLAVTRSTYGEMRELGETREMMISLFEEIYLVSRKAGVYIDHEFINKTVSFVDSFPYDATSSLTRDVWEGKPSEIEYQNGTVVRLGEKYNVPTPVNRFIYNCILPMEIRARKKVIIPKK